MDTQSLINQIEIGIVASAASMALAFLGIALQRAAGYLSHIHHSALALMMVRAFQDAIPSELNTPETLALKAFMKKTGKTDIDAVPYINEALQKIKTQDFTPVELKTVVNNISPVSNLGN